MTRGLTFATGVVCLTALAQSPARATFDVASIKPHPHPDRQEIRFPQFLPGGRFEATIQLGQIVNAAFGLPINTNPRSSINPDALKELGAVYDIDATGTFAPELAANARAERQKLMLQSLLAERFKLIVHHETKEMPVYALTVARAGPKLQKSDIAEKDCPTSLGIELVAFDQAECHAFMGGQGRGLHARAATIADMVHFVENWTQRPFVDKTGIKGLYKFDTSGWQPLQAGPAPPEGAKGEDGRDFADVPTLFQVMAGLGLKMESQRARVDVLFIDHAEPPTAN